MLGAAVAFEAARRPATIGELWDELRLSGAEPDEAGSAEVASTRVVVTDGQPAPLGLWQRWSSATAGERIAWISLLTALVGVVIKVLT